MSGINLNIKDYSISDLELFLKLKINYEYTASEIESKVNEVREILLSTGHISKMFKRDLILFLQEAKELLIQNKVKALKPHTSLPSNNQISETFTLFPNQYVPIPIITRKDEILERNVNSFSYVQKSDFFPGELNPLDIRTINKCMSIDTRFRSDIHKTDSTNYFLKIPTKVSKVVSLSCTSFEIPSKSIPNISSNLNNNFITLRINEKQKIHITVPDAFYTVNSLVDYINSKISDSISLEYDTNSDRIEIKSMKEYNLELDLQTNNLGVIDTNNNFTRLGNLLGFTGATCVSHEGSLTADNTPNLFISIPYLYLCVNDFQNTYTSCFEPSSILYNTNPYILSRIKLLPSLHENAFENIEILSVPRRYFGPIDIDRFHISLIDPYGNIVSLKYKDYSFCLSLTILYDL